MNNLQLVFLGIIFIWLGKMTLDLMKTEKSYAWFLFEMIGGAFLVFIGVYQVFTVLGEITI